MRIATRELRNDTAGVLRRVQAGEEVVVTVKGEAVAKLVPIVPERRRWIPKTELLELLRTSRADPGLREQVRELSGGPDDLPPIR
jgi:prevent-host-death family protein